MRSKLDFVTPGAKANQVREVGDDGMVILEGHPFVYQVDVADTDDGPVVVGLQITSLAGEAVEITTNDLRRIPLKRLAYAAKAMRTGEILSMISEPAKRVGGFAQPEPRDADLQPAKRPGSGGHPIEFYERIAALYRAANDPAVNTKPMPVYRFISAEIARETGERTSDNTVKSRLKRAHALGVLPEYPIIKRRK